MGCIISPILFVLAMEVIIRSVKKVGPGIASHEGDEFPPLHAFMDDLTLLSPSEEAVVAILTKLEKLMNCGRKKSRSLVFKKGRLVDTHFLLCGEEIPSIQEQPVKSLQRWYAEELKDTRRVHETAKQVAEGLESIDKCGLPGKL